MTHIILVHDMGCDGLQGGGEQQAVVMRKTRTGIDTRTMNANFF